MIKVSFVYLFILFKSNKNFRSIRICKTRFDLLILGNSEITLEKTGNMISYMTNILVNDEEGESMIHEDFERNENENSHTNSNKLYSLFYKRNWNKNSEPICHE